MSILIIGLRVKGKRVQYAMCVTFINQNYCRCQLFQRRVFLLLVSGLTKVLSSCLRTKAWQKSFHSSGRKRKEKSHRVCVVYFVGRSKKKNWQDKNFLLILIIPFFLFSSLFSFRANMMDRNNVDTRRKAFVRWFSR